MLKIKKYRGIRATEIYLEERRERREEKQRGHIAGRPVTGVGRYGNIGDIEVQEI